MKEVHYFLYLKLFEIGNIIGQKPYFVFTFPLAGWITFYLPLLVEAVYLDQTKAVTDQTNFPFTSRLLKCLYIKYMLTRRQESEEG